MTEVQLVGSGEVQIGDEVVAIKSYSLKANGVEVHVTNVGASIAKILVPNYAQPEAAVDDVVLGYDSTLSLYESRNPPYLATIVGRVANRIAKGRFVLDGQEYQVATNNGPNHLHGGEDGFSHRVWNAEVVENGTNVQFTLESPDGDQNYPGSVQVSATYSLVASEKGGAVLKLAMAGKLLDGNKASPLNMAQHSYFNLAGHAHSAGILDHKLTMPSEFYTPVDPTSIPTREVRSLDDDAAMDWRSGRVIRDALIEFGVNKGGLSAEVVNTHFGLSRIAPDLAKAGANSSNPDEPYGFDHNYVVLKKNAGMNLVGILEDKETARRLTVTSDAPGVQLYTANWLDGSNKEISKENTAYSQWQGICLETQTYPDGIMDNDSESPEFALGKCFILRPGGPDYAHRVEYHLGPIS